MTELDKKCSLCKLVKSLDSFSMRSKMKGTYLACCKDCANAYAREYYQKNRERYAANHKKYYLDNRDRLNEYQRSYFQTALGKRFLKRSYDNASMKYPEKKVARQTLHGAILAGKIIKPTKCSQCSSSGRIEGHHEDYTRPLEVIWLCTLCHKRLEGKLHERIG